MPYFKNQEEMYAVQRAFFSRVAANPEIGPALQRSGLIIRFMLHDPDGAVTIDCRQPGSGGGHFTTVFGESDLRPDLTLFSSADFSHEFWQGKGNIFSALVSGKVRVGGDFNQALKIVPALKPLSAVYAQVLADLGRGDLVLK